MVPTLLNLLAKGGRRCLSKYGILTQDSEDSGGWGWCEGMWGGVRGRWCTLDGDSKKANRADQDLVTWVGGSGDGELGRGGGGKLLVVD